jgi:hypothetical protein
VQFQYLNVKKDKSALELMLGFTKGGRDVPVIVDDGGRVTVGFGGS